MNRKESLKKLLNSTILSNFVEEKSGTWNHSDWESLCKMIAKEGFKPIDFDAVGLELERLKEEYWSNKA